MRAKVAQNRARAGFTLLEVATVIAGISVILIFAGITVVTVVKTGRSSATALQTLTVQKELADQFRTDVAHATAAPDEFGRYRAGPACLLLRLAHDDIVVYRWESGLLERSLLARSGPTRWQVPVGGSSVVPQFDRSGVDRGIVTLRLNETPARLKATVEISAALGGDLR